MRIDSEGRRVNSWVWHKMQDLSKLAQEKEAAGDICGRNAAMRAMEAQRKYLYDVHYTEHTVKQESRKRTDTPAYAEFVRVRRRSR